MMYRIFTAMLAALLVAGSPLLKAQEKFSFFVIGDMPYNNPHDLERFPQVVKAINAEKPTFTVHVGDIKSGQSPCTDEHFEAIKKVFDQFDGPLIYTPGDNEWTDCGRPACGGYDPEERLTKLRALFYPDGKSLGRKPVSLISQRSTPGFEKFVENVRWRKGRVSFTTLHVVGTNNNLKAGEEDNAEFYEREKANLFWVEETFRLAKAADDCAVVIFLHASMFHVEPSPVNGFESLLNKLKAEVKAFQKPVLLIYGDLHRLLISKPLKDADNKLLPNFTALMVFGAPDMHAVKIDVDTRSKAVFSFTEFIMHTN